MFLILLISVIHPENYLYPNAISLVIVNEPQSKMEEQSEIQIEEELGKTRIFSISCEFVDKFMAKTEFKCSKISWKNLRNLTIFLQREESVANIEDTSGKSFQMTQNGRIMAIGQSKLLPTVPLASKIELGETIINEDLNNLLVLLTKFNSPTVPEIEIVGEHVARFKFPQHELYFRTDINPEISYSRYGTTMAYYKARGQNISKLDLRYAEPVVIIQ
ncbi:hypothetical protein A3A70_02680 [candidate division WWE3 bacterium RIFCSPLOWO2_01_FULL_42_11]|uniref:Uncharacterized protein n=1 Tax=candidate division WWE3 bacterium RIFCSPLOWO2_01_FULL_42_11 TaxID=1802627 RepID=A0A1F4VQ45_UNCKA|nr:MAG: hypothetical protein A3A70_02680 [candidate division WWE3 bacterium RIFCSPLOWO2_01_FULL_42_11]